MDYRTPLSSAIDDNCVCCCCCRSVFVRNCHSCQLVCITRQLRTRDCKDCSVLLRSRTRPIIESSTGIALGCYCTPYAGLAQQMAAVQLSPLHNFWSDVFDFTPAEAAAGEQSSKHWRLLPAGISLQQHMGQLPEQVQQLLGHAAHDEQQHQQAAVQPLTEQDRQAAVCTAGALCSLQDIPEGSFAFLLFPPGHAAVLQWLAVQFPCPASSSPTSRRSSNGDGHSDNAGIAEVDDIAIDECSAPAAADDDATQVASSQEQQEQQAQQQQECQQLLLHTNEAAVPAEVLQQIAAAAGWSHSQLKQLSASHTAAAKGVKQDKLHTCYIGVEVSCTSVAQQAAVCSGTASMGALACSSLQAAKLFRNLGTDS
jgi:hypothetical protein